MNNLTNKKNILISLVAILVATISLVWLQISAPLDRKLLDAEFNFLRTYAPISVPDDIVIVGIDENSFSAIREPFAMWHSQLGSFLQAMVNSEAAVVGLDIALPERSYQFLAPNSDHDLLTGIWAMRGKVPLVLAQTLDDHAKPRAIFPPYIAIAGQDALSTVSVCLDSDGVLRRVDTRGCTLDMGIPTLSERLAEKVGLKTQANGLVNFTLGSPFSYIPFHRVLAWQKKGDNAQLKASFSGKFVLLGGVLPFTDRHRLPVALAAWEPEVRNLPGVLLHAQALRSLLYGGMNRMVLELPTFVYYLFSFMAALFWFGRTGNKKVAIFSGLLFLVLVAATWLLHQGVYFQAGTVLVAGLLAFSARLTYDSILQMRERAFLRRSFSSYVSPDVMKAILDGSLRPEMRGQKTWAAVLFSDIRGFTTISERTDPAQLIEFLNDYLATMSDVVHAHQGTVFSFMGDGIMAVFGCPGALPQPEKSALEAAQDMLVKLDIFNARHPELPIRIGIGIHSGDLMSGHVGSDTRSEFTVIGDVVNTAARLEGMTKDLGYPIVCSSEAAKAAGYEDRMDNLGDQQVRGRAPLQVYGLKV